MKPVQDEARRVYDRPLLLFWAPLVLLAAPLAFLFAAAGVLCGVVLGIGFVSKCVGDDGTSWMTMGAFWLVTGTWQLGPIALLLRKALRYPALRLPCAVAGFGALVGYAAFWGWLLGEVLPEVMSV